MNEMSIDKQISECRKRRREYMRLIKDLDIMRTSYARSIAIETSNIAKLKKQLKEQKAKND